MSGTVSGRPTASNAGPGSPGAVDPALVNWTLDNTDVSQGVTIVDRHGNELEIAPPFSADGSAGGGSSSLLGGLLGGLPFNFLSQMQPASWRGQEFAVLGSSVRVGRRKSLHEYPFRDGLWVEDLGLRGRVFGFVGFLIGDDVGEQMESFLKLAEAPGLGELVHPTFGSRQVEILECDAGDRWDAGRVWTMRLEFVEPQAPILLQPQGEEDTAAGVSAAADDAESAAGGDFFSRIGSSLRSGFYAVQGVVAAVKPYITTALRLAGDATRLVNTVQRFAGGPSLGRYSLGRGGALSAVQGGLRTAVQVEGAVRGAIAFGNRARAFVGAAATRLSGLLA